MGEKLDKKRSSRPSRPADDDVLPKHWPNIAQFEKKTPDDVRRPEPLAEQVSLQGYWRRRERAVSRDVAVEFIGLVRQDLTGSSDLYPGIIAADC